jgi:hypothetical protein
MKRIITIASTGAMLLAVAALPAAASAQGQHHRRHHARVHAHLQSFGTTSATAPASGDAGTITSFTAGVLTIKLADGSSVSGKVTPTTELKCESAVPTGTPTVPAGTPTARTADNGAVSSDSNSSQTPSGDGHSGLVQGQSGPETTPGSESGDDNGQDVGNTEDQQGPPTTGGAACDTTALTPGAVIRQAELSVTTAGASFVEVEIVR